MPTLILQCGSAAHQLLQFSLLFFFFLCFIDLVTEINTDFIFVFSHNQRLFLPYILFFCWQKISACKDCQKDRRCAKMPPVTEKCEAVAVGSFAAGHQLQCSLYLAN